MPSHSFCCRLGESLGVGNEVDEVLLVRHVFESSKGLVLVLSSEKTQAEGDTAVGAIRVLGVIQ